MIITKKKFDEAMAKVRAEEQARFEKWQDERDEKHWIDDRMCQIDRRMNNAFGDIDRRLTELEKRPTVHPDAPMCPKY